MPYLLNLNLWFRILQRELFQAPQIQQPRSVRLLLLQIILVILMSTLLLDWESQPMDQSLQIQRMLQGQ